MYIVCLMHEYDMAMMVRFSTLTQFALCHLHTRFIFAFVVKNGKFQQDAFPITRAHERYLEEQASE